uniref:Uncharacterized protein n=1 Tax=Leersia perrieri TaxID=77586 RepID=A0A0D9W5R1_9ORYZ
MSTGKSTRICHLDFSDSFTVKWPHLVSLIVLPPFLSRQILPISPPSTFLERGHGEALLPSHRLLRRRRGVRSHGRRRRGSGDGGDGGGGVGPGEQVRVHDIRADGVDLEGRDGLGDRGDAAGLGRVRGADQQPGEVGRPDGERTRLLRAWQPRHLQRPRAVHEPAAVPDEPHLRRHGLRPRLVLQLPRGHHHGAPPRLRAAALHRRAVARHRRLAVPPLRRRRQLQEGQG